MYAGQLIVTSSWRNRWFFVCYLDETREIKRGMCIDVKKIFVNCIQRRFNRITRIFYIEKINQHVGCLYENIREHLHRTFCHLYRKKNSRKRGTRLKKINYARSFGWTPESIHSSWLRVLFLSPFKFTY